MGITLVLFAFSGPTLRPESFPEKCEARGAHGVCIDVLLDPSGHDLADDHIFGKLCQDLSRPFFQAGLWSPPCGTFSPVRRLHVTGDDPKPLRTERGKGRYGIAGLSPSESEAVRVGTLLAVNTSKALWIHIRRKIPFIFETPEPRAGHPNITNLDEFELLLAQPGVFVKIVDQCTMGAPTRKPTCFVYFLVAWSPDPIRCSHAAKWWVIPSSNSWSWGPHPQLRGKEWPIPEEEWSQHKTYTAPPSSAPFLSAAAAAYPGRLNAWLADSLVHAARAAALAAIPASPCGGASLGGGASVAAPPPQCCDGDGGGEQASSSSRPPPIAKATRSVFMKIDRVQNAWVAPQRCWLAERQQRPPPGDSSPLVRKGKWRNVLARGSPSSIKVSLGSPPPSDERRGNEQVGVRFSTPLRGGPENAFVTDGARTAAEAKALSGMRRPARAVARSPMAVEEGRRVAAVTQRVIDEYPDVVAKIDNLIGNADADANSIEPVVEACRSRLADHWNITNVRPSDDGTHSTELRAELLGGWRAAAGDPDDQPEQWLAGGAPGGVRAHPLDRGVFPIVPADERPAVEDPEALHTDFDEFVNYLGTECDDDAFQELERLVGKKFVRRFDTLDEVIRFLDGETPVLSRIGIITKLRGGKLRKRIVLDLKQSGLTSASAKTERVLLAKALDPIWDMLDLLADVGSVDPDNCEWLVLDFSDAFWMLPLHKAERRFFVAKFRGRFYCFVRVAQGSRGAPLVWGRLAALLMRLTQAAVCGRQARIEDYVDDPIISLCGCRAYRSRTIAIVVLLWSAIGFPLAFQKGARGTTVTWIVAKYSVISTGTEVTLKQAIIDDVSEILGQLSKSNVVPFKLLRSFCGKISCMAFLIFAMTPFLGELWSALADGMAGDRSSGAPTNCIWRRQMQLALDWIA